MTVSAAEQSTLRCIFSYYASYIALSDQYGIACDIEKYQNKMCQAHRYLFLSNASSCIIPENIICEIKDFIDLESRSSFYTQMAHDCSLVTSPCTLNYSIASDPSCSQTLNINILL